MQINRLLAITSNSMSVGFAINTIGIKSRQSQASTTGPTQMAQFATAIATRYDGKHGHGKIDSFEIGNEEYDQHYTGDPVTSEQCRQASNYGPVLKAGYQAIKAVYPTATVGMFGQWLRNID